MRKSLLHILSLVMVTSVLLAACATPTPQVIVQTAAPVVQTQVVVQTAAPVVQTQVVVQTAAPVVQTQMVEVTVAGPTLIPPTITPSPVPKATYAPGKIPVRWYVGLGTGTDANQIALEQAVMDDFNNDPARAKDNIQLILEIIPYASAKDTLMTEIAGGSGPDIVGPVGWSGSNTFFGQWRDLSDLMKAANFDNSDFDPALVKMYETAQGTVGIPFAVYPSAIFYNTKLFDEAGLNYPPAKYGEQYKMPDGTMADWSWDTVAKVAKLLTVDKAGKHSGEAGFDKTAIVQYGFTWQFEGEMGYWGSYWAGGADVTKTTNAFLAPGGSPGTYKANVPDAWLAAWKWTYDAMWGNEPFMENGQVRNSADFANGNPFNSGKLAMTDEPLWYTCCMGDVKTWDMAAMPTYNGKVGGRVDADTFRMWKGTAHPKEAFVVMQYLTGPAVQKLIIGTKDVPPAYGALPGRTSQQQPYYDNFKALYPWVKNVDLIKAGLAYPDVPSAEGWMPNFAEAWTRQHTLWSLLDNKGGLDVDKEVQTMVGDLNVIFNK